MPPQTGCASERRWWEAWGADAETRIPPPGHQSTLNNSHVHSLTCSLCPPDLKAMFKDEKGGRVQTNSGSEVSAAVQGGPVVND